MSGTTATSRARHLKPELSVSPHELVPEHRTPDTIEGWKALANGLLSSPCCAFHRNVQISSRYAWIFQSEPRHFKWAAMAAIASHHVRLVLFPLRLDTDRAGYVDIPHSLLRRKFLLMQDVNTIRETNNAIFDDIFWAHLAYVTDDGVGRLRALLHDEPNYASMLAGFETIDRGRQVLADGMATSEDARAAEDLIWMGNVQLLQHEQSVLVQPHFDRLSCSFARLISIGAATSFEVRGLRREAACFTSFYAYSLTRGARRSLSTNAWPRITRFDDRWNWLLRSVVPRFQQLDADPRALDDGMRRILDDARAAASSPCMAPGGGARDHRTLRKRRLLTSSRRNASH